MDAIIRAKLGLDTTDWTANAKSSAQDATRLKGAVTEAAAGVALLEKQFRAAGGATAEQTKALTALRTEYATLKRDCEAAEAQVKKFNAVAGPVRTNPYQPPPIAARRNGAEGGAGLTPQMRGMMLEHSARAIGDELMAGQSPIRAVSMEAPRLAESLGMSLAPTMGLLAGGLLVQKMAEAGEQAKKLQRDLVDAFAPLGGGGDQFQSLEVLHEHITRIQGSLKEMLAVQGTASHTLGQMFNDVSTSFKNGGNMTKGDYGAFQDRSEIDAAFNAMRNDVDGEAAKMGRENALKRRAASEGSEALTIPEIESKRDERIGDLRRSGLPDADKLIAKVKEQAAIEIDAANRVHEAKVREVALEGELLGIKREGENADVRGAQARVAAAQKTLEAGPKSGVEHDTNVNRLEAARQAEAHTAQGAAQKLADDATAGRLAGFTGPEAAKQRAEVDARRRSLMEQLHEGSPTYEPNADKRAEINTRLLPEVEGQAHGLDRADTHRAMQRRQDQISADSEPGYGGHVETLQKQIGHNAIEQMDNALHEKDVNIASRLTAEAAHLRKELEQIQFDETERLGTIDRQTEAIQKQGVILDGAEKKARIRAEFQAQIDKANHENNPAEAAAKEKQRDAELHNVDIDEANMTPAQRLARDAHNRKRQYEEAMGAQPHTLDSQGPDSFVHDSQGPDTKIPFAGKGPHSAYSSPDNTDIPDNANIPDNPSIPDNAMPSFDQQDSMNVHPWDSMPAYEAPTMDAPQASNGGPDNSDLIAALQQMTDSFAQQVIMATTASV